MRPAIIMARLDAALQLFNMPLCVFSDKLYIPYLFVVSLPCNCYKIGVTALCERFREIPEEDIQMRRGNRKVSCPFSSQRPL